MRSNFSFTGNTEKTYAFLFFLLLIHLQFSSLMLQLPLVKAGKSNRLFIQHTYNKLLLQRPINLLDSFRTYE